MENSSKMNETIVGFYLVMMSLLPNGEVDGVVLDYFKDPYVCVQTGVIEESQAPLGVGFVCLEDVVTK